MRVFIDTNILISAALWTESNPSKAFFKAVSYPNKGIICEQNIDEMLRVFNKKFPDRISSMEKFLSFAMLALEFVPVPCEKNISEGQIRDVNDRPILRAAINANADLFLTGDKDFLQSGVKNPKIISASDFLKIEFE